MSAAISAAAQPAQVHSPRTQLLLHGADRADAAAPGLAERAGDAGAGLDRADRDLVRLRLGTDALAGMALVFPGFMLMQMLSGGAMGGGISSAIARALGARPARRRRRAGAARAHHQRARSGLVFSALVLAFGPPLYRALGGEGGSLEAALRYSNVVFAGTALVWLMNALASVIRGTGNMFVPASAICVGVVLLVPLSPCLIFGLGPFPALGIAGGGVAVVFTTALTAAVLGWYVLSGRSLVRCRLVRLRWALFRDILRVGAVAAVTRCRPR